MSRFRSRRVHFNFLRLIRHPVSGVVPENSGSAEHKSFGAIVWIVVIMLILVALAAHGMAIAINPPN